MKTYTINDSMELVRFIHNNNNMIRGKKLNLPILTIEGMKYIKEMAYGPLYINTNKAFNSEGISECFSGYNISQVFHPENLNYFNYKELLNIIIALFGNIPYIKDINQRKNQYENHKYWNFNAVDLDYPIEVYSPKEIVKENGYPNNPDIDLYDTIYTYSQLVNKMIKSRPFGEFYIQSISNEKAIINYENSEVDDIEIPIILNNEYVELNEKYPLNKKFFQDKSNLQMLITPYIPIDCLLESMNL